MNKGLRPSLFLIIGSEFNQSGWIKVSFHKNKVHLQQFSKHSLRKSVCILIVLILILQTFNKVWIMVSFKVNQDYIATTLCENKDKPEMHCNGRCVLMKKLKQAEENEQKQRTQNQEKATVLFFCKLNRLKVSAFLLSPQHGDFNAYYLNFKPSSFQNDIFKPPQAIHASS